MVDLTKIRKCGIVMPISAIDGCDEGHWLQVRDILNDAISSAAYEPNLVSDADDIGVIQKRIVQNLYDNPIVVCDVSGKNPNVMLELGMRLAFDKPVIIIKDDQTSYSFDTAPIEHLSYPRDLRYHAILEFKGLLAKKIISTDKAASALNEGYTTFLGHFGTFTVPKLDQKEVAAEKYILEQLDEIKLEIRQLRATPGTANFGGEISLYPLPTRMSMNLIDGILVQNNLKSVTDNAELVRRQLASELKRIAPWRDKDDLQSAVEDAISSYSSHVRNRRHTRAASKIKPTEF